MAFILDDEKLNDPNQQQQQGQQQQQFGSSGPSLVQGGQSSNVVGSPGAGGGGAAGSGAWTNIQAYLNANKGDTGSAQTLQNTVGTQFDKEKSEVESETGKLKSDAQGVANKVTEAKNNVGSWVDQAANDYRWDGQQSDVYSQNTSKIRDAINAQYNGPTSYARGISNQSQQYGSALGDDSAFNQFMGDMYNKQAGGQLSSGGRQLQAQLDVNNVNLVNTRKALADKYQGLNQFLTGAVKDTNDTLRNSEEAVRTGQNSLRDYFSGQPESLETEIGKQEAAAKDAYNTSFTTDRSGLDSANADAIRKAWESIAAYNSTNQGDSPSLVDNYGGGYLLRQGPDIWGNNLTWSNIARDQGLEAPDANYLNSWNAADYRNQRLGENKAALDQFYKGQDEKYFNTADKEKRRFNTIEEILGNSARKQRGFQVRG